MAWRGELTFDLSIRDRGRGISIDGELVELLRGVRDEGSLARAVRRLGISYRHAWDIIIELESRLGQAVVVTFRGGASGGRSELTTVGEEIVERYERFSRAVEEAFRREILENDLRIEGSHCIGIDLLTRLLKRRYPEMRIHVAAVGSKAGLEAVSRREADIAGIHIYDQKTDTYNVEAVRLIPHHGELALVRGYRREQGLIVRRGNPKGIRDMVDLMRRDVKFINRNIGSGTRMLIDRILDELARSRGFDPVEIRELIDGYDNEVRTHIDVALAVLRGRADVGVGIRAVAERYRLRFISLIYEDFDFAIARSSLNKEEVRSFIELLASDEFREAVHSHAPGLTVSSDTGSFLP